MRFSHPCICHSETKIASPAPDSPPRNPHPPHHINFSRPSVNLPRSRFKEDSSGRAVAGMCLQSLNIDRKPKAEVPSRSSQREKRGEKQIISDFNWPICQAQGCWDAGMLDASSKTGRKWSMEILVTVVSCDLRRPSHRGCIIDLSARSGESVLEE